MSKGIVYVATGQKYIDEVLTSARSVKDTMSGIDITIISDQFVSSPDIDRHISIDDPHGDYRDKLEMSRSPYDKTIFLDSDTFVVDDITDIFQVLQRFDIAASHAPYRETHDVSDLPLSFPEYNTGVIGFRRSSACSDFFDMWKEIYHQRIDIDDHDQPSFRKALFESEARIHTLPPEYNCRFIYPGYAESQVKVFHGPPESAKSIVGKINKQKIPRVYYQTWGHTRVQHIGLTERIYRSIRNRGLKSTIKKGLSDIFS